MRALCRWGIYVHTYMRGDDDRTRNDGRRRDKRIHEIGDALEESSRVTQDLYGGVEVGDKHQCKGVGVNGVRKKAE